MMFSSFQSYMMRSELRGKINWRDLVRLGLWVTGGEIVPSGLMGQANIVPTLSSKIVEH